MRPLLTIAIVCAVTAGLLSPHVNAGVLQFDSAFNFLRNTRWRHYATRQSTHPERYSLARPTRIGARQYPELKRNQFSF